MRLLRALAVSLLIAPGIPSGAAAEGAWATFMRATVWNDLAVRDGAVWCGTLDAGLLRFDLDGGTFDHFVREPGGLAGNTIAAIAFDRSGRLWAGTLGRGASVLDPDRATWRLVNAFDGLPSDSVRVVEADGDTLWLGTTRGLALWNGHEISGVLPDGVGPSPFASNRITGVAVHGDTVWVATERGIHRSLRSAGLGAWTAVNAGLPSSLAVDALASDGHTVFALSSLGVYRHDRPADRWVLQPGLGAVWRLSDDAGRVAVSSALGIALWNGSGWDVVAPDLVSTSVPRDQYAVGIAGDGSLYAASRFGLRVLATGGLYPPPGAPGNNILNIEIDGPRVYVTTLNEGVGRYSGGAWKYWFPGKTRTDSTFRNPVFFFAATTDRDGRKWFAHWAPLIDLDFCVPDTGAVEVLDDRDSPPTVTHIVIDDDLEPARHSFGWTAMLDSAGGIWFGMGSPCPEIVAITPIGLEHYDPTGAYAGNHRPDNSEMRGREVRALTQDRTHTVWVGYKGQGIDVFEGPPSGPADPSFTQVPETSGLDVRGLEAHGDSVWAFTTSDLRCYSLSLGLADTLAIPAGPADLSVRPLDVGPDGTVWLGTLAGVRAYRRDGTRRDYTTANTPLPDDEVRTVRVDRGSGVVWIGTARGLARFDPGLADGGGAPVRLDVRVFPNPARLTALGIGLRLATNGERPRGAVYDLSGRRVRSFSVAGSDRVIWDGRDAGGGLVEPGIYFVRIESGGRSAVARVAVVR